MNSEQYKKDKKYFHNALDSIESGNEFNNIWNFISLDSKNRANL